MTARYRVRELTGWAADLIECLGAPPWVAGVVARHLVDADASGHRSHGLRMLPSYLAAIRAGELVPAAEPVVCDERPARIVVDGNAGFGHYALDWTLRQVMRRSEVTGVCLANIIHCGHVGRLGGYALAGAERDKVVLIGVGTVADEVDALVAPAGGREPLLGTNPLAFGHPGEPPVVLDMSTSAMAYYQLRQLADADASVPEGVLIDAAGAPAERARDVLRGGVLLPFGGYKGYGLSVLVGLLGGLATPPGRPAGGVFVLAVDKPDGGGAGAASAARLRSAVPAGADPVTVPGDRARAAYAASLRDGVELPDALLTELTARLAEAPWYGNPPAPPSPLA